MRAAMGNLITSRRALGAELRLLAGAARKVRSGLGCVSFDLDWLGWRRDAFEAQQRFVVAVIDAALPGRGWDRLPNSHRSPGPL
jgi:hypothetical protein